MPTPLPVIAKTFRCALDWRNNANGQIAENVMHIQAGGGGPTSSDIFEALQDAVTTNMWLAVSGNAVIQTVSITPLDGTSATQSFVTGSGAQWAGSASGDTVPAAALVIKGQTIHRGRDNRGRLYLPFITEAEMADGQVSPSAVTTMQAAWTAFLAAMNADADAEGPYSPGVAAYDRKHGGAGAHFTGYFQYVVEGTLGTQRRRQSRLR